MRLSSSPVNSDWNSRQNSSHAKSEALCASPFITISRGAGSDFQPWNAENAIPYVESFSENGIETFYLFVNGITYYYSITWTESEDGLAQIINKGNVARRLNPYQRSGYSGKNGKEGIRVEIARWTSGYDEFFYYDIESYPNHQFDYKGSQNFSTREEPILRKSIGPMNIVGEDYAVSSFDINLFPVFSRKEPVMRSVEPGLNLPSGARVFVDGAAYLWGKSIYMFFVGTGIIFSRTLEKGSFGYLDTTSVLGAITQFGYLDYSQDEGTLYLLGQDTTNKVKLAKIVLNTLYDYANDGAWLPQLASDGVPAYIRAIQTEAPSGDRKVTINLIADYSSIRDSFYVYFNGERLAFDKTYTRTISAGVETFTIELEKTGESEHHSCYLYINDSQILNIPTYAPQGEKKTVTLRWEDYSDTLTITGRTS